MRRTIRWVTSRLFYAIVILHSACTQVTAQEDLDAGHHKDVADVDKSSPVEPDTSDSGVVKQAEQFVQDLEELKELIKREQSR